MSKIEIYSRGLRGALGLVDIEHVYFLYTDDAGRQWSLSMGGTSNSSGSWNGGPNQRFQVETGEFVPGSFDYPGVGDEHTRLGVVIEGSGSPERWLDMHDRMYGIASRNFYDAEIQNSNSAARKTLIDSGGSIDGIESLSRLDIKQEFGVELPGWNNLQLSFLPDGQGNFYAYADDATVKYLVQADGTPVRTEP